MQKRNIIEDIIPAEQEAQIENIERILQTHGSIIMPSSELPMWYVLVSDAIQIMVELKENLFFISSVEMWRIAQVGLIAKSVEEMDECINIWKRNR